VTKKGYQPRKNILKDGKCDLVTDSHSILKRQRNHFSQLLNIQGFNDVRQTEIHTAGPLVPEPSAFKLEMANEKLKRHKSLGTDQIPAEFIKAEDRKFALKIINLLIIFGIRRICLRSGRSHSFYLSIRKALKQILVII